MKRSVTFVLALVMALSVFCIPAFADGHPDLVKVLMTSEGVKIAPSFSGRAITAEEMAAAVRNCEDGIIPQGAKVVPGRLELYQQRAICSEVRPVYDITIKVWSTIGKPLCLFFKANDSDEWVLVSCHIGDIVEGRFYSDGTYAVAVAY